MNHERFPRFGDQSILHVLIGLSGSVYPRRFENVKHLKFVSLVA